MNYSLSMNYSQLTLYRSRRDLFEMTEFRYKGCCINGVEVLRENIHFDISECFVIFEFDMEGINCSQLRSACVFRMVPVSSHW